MIRKWILRSQTKSNLCLDMEDTNLNEVYVEAKKPLSYTVAFRGCE